MASQDWAYLPDVPRDIGPIRKILLEYSKISPADVDGHILRVREAAWKVSRFPCVGRWKFLRLTDQNDPCYQQVLFRLKVPRSNDAFLDLGCCVGQALRQLRHDGVEGSQLFGVDVQSKFVDIGYDLFQDRRDFCATFVIGDILDPDDRRLDELSHKVTIIYACSFFHLFNWIQQLYIGIRLVGFLKHGTKNALLYGRHIGTGSPRSKSSTSTAPYLHNKNSFQQLWNEVGEVTNTRWTVEWEPASEMIHDLPNIEKEVQPIDFMVHQVT